MKKYLYGSCLFVFLFLITACATALDRAAQAVEEGNYDQALIEYDTALSEGLEGEDQFTALTGRAWVYNQQGKTAEALADYATALTVTNSDGVPAGDIKAVYRSRIDILTKDEQWQPAAEEIDSLLSIEPNNLELFIEQGQLLTRAEAWEAVVASMDKALASNPSNADALTLRGSAHLKLANYEQAIDDLKSSLDGEIAAAMSDIDRRSNLIEAYYELGQTMYRLGEPQDAIDNFTEALTFADSDEDISQILAERGFAYSELDQYDNALADLDQALSIDPNKAIAYSYRSYVYSNQQDFDAAIADADRAIELGTDLSDGVRSAIFHAKASALRNNGDYEAAIEAANESIKLEEPDAPDAARTYSLRSQLNRYLENYDQAVADADKAITIGAQDIGALPGFYHNRSQGYFGLDQYAPAIEDQLAAIELGWETAADYEYLGDLYSYAGDLDKSVSAYQTAIGLDPENAWLHYYLGDIYSIFGETQSAVVEFLQAGDLDPQEATFPAAAGDMYLSLGDYTAAEASYKKSLELDPTNPWAHNYLGDVYYETDQYELAASQYQSAFELDNTIALFPENLGLVLRLQDDYSRSVEAYSQALAIDPDRPYSWFGRGYSNYWLEQDAAAIPDLQKAKEYEIEQDLIDFIDELLAEMGA